MGPRAPEAGATSLRAAPARLTLARESDHPTRRPGGAFPSLPFFAPYIPGEDPRVGVMLAESRLGRVFYGPAPLATPGRIQKCPV